MKCYRANKLMLNQFGNDLLCSDVHLPKGVQDKINNGVVETYGMVVLKGDIGNVGGPKSPRYINNTCSECFANHFHVDDFLDSDDTRNIGLQIRIAVTFLAKLEMILRKEFPHDQFRGIIGGDDESGVNVRFHRIYGDETWLGTDLEAFQEEYICEFDLP